MTEHGTASRYALGCRCTACRTAKSRADTARRDTVRALGAKYPRLIPHGEPRGYAHWGCRCPKCVLAMSVARQSWRSRQPRTAK